MIKIKTDRAEKKRITYLKNLKKAKTYVPFLNIRNARKMSRRTLLTPLKSSHVHHLLSDGETALFMENEPKQSVQAIYEQFPLLQFERAIEIAEELGIRYPTDKDGQAVILCVDQLVHYVSHETGKEFFIGQTYKPRENLHIEKKGKRSVKRTLEKFQIEKAYLSDFGIDYKILTSLTVSKIKSANIGWARESVKYLNSYKDILSDVIKAILILHYQRPKTPLYILIQTISKELDIDVEVVLKAIQYIIWSDRIRIDHSVKINLMGPLKLLKEVNTNAF